MTTPKSAFLRIRCLTIAHIPLMYLLTQGTGFVQLIVDHGLEQVICLDAKALELSLVSTLGHCLVYALIASSACFSRVSPASTIPSSILFIFGPGLLISRAYYGTPRSSKGHRRLAFLKPG